MARVAVAEVSPALAHDHRTRALRNRAAAQSVALRQLQTQAQAGDATAQYYLGTLFDANHALDRRIVYPDPAQAAQWYRKSADKGNAGAAFSMGALYFAGKGVNQDLAESAKLVTAAAAAGNSYAQVAAARLYELCNLPKDFSRSVEFLEKAAEQGHHMAEIELALDYASGRGVPRDYARAGQWLRKSQIAARKIPDPDDSSVLFAFSAATAPGCEAAAPITDLMPAILTDANRNDANAQFVLGMVYLDFVIPPDPAAAVSWLQKAAASGQNDAAFQLGELYRDGASIARDRVKSVFFFRKAADAGDAAASYELARLYDSGLRPGIDPPNYAQSVKLFRAAANAGNAAAQAALAGYYETGVTGLKRDTVQAVLWYQKAADAGEAEAAEKLGKLYETGVPGAPRNPTRAGQLYLKALELGNHQAGCDLANLYARGLVKPAGARAAPGQISAAALIEAYKWWQIVAARCPKNDRCPMSDAEAGMKSAAESLTTAQIEQARKAAVAWLEEHGEM